MPFTVKMAIPKGLDDKYITAGLATLQEDVMPNLASHKERCAFLELAKREGWPVEYSTLVTDDRQLELCVKAFWWSYEKILRRKGLYK